MSSHPNLTFFRNTAQRITLPIGSVHPNLSDGKKIIAGTEFYRDIDLCRAFPDLYNFQILQPDITEIKNCMKNDLIQQIQAEYCQ